MKPTLAILLLLLILPLVSNRLIVIRTGNDNLWDEYKKFYEKDYTPEEDRLRKPRWMESMKLMFDHNMAYHAGQESFHVGMNQFSDMDHEDFQNSLTGLENEMECKSNSSMTYSPPKTNDIPTALDWNEKGYVTEVLNQGKCGACWAFCSVASLEGQLKRMTGKLVKLSEQNLIDCSNQAGNKGCEGGQMCRAFEYAAFAGGVDTSASYPLTKETGACKYHEGRLGATVGGYLEIPYGDEDALLKAVALLGPVAAGVDGSTQHFRHYRGGIYDYDGCSNTTLNHAVTVIGYGTEMGTDYWLIKNSWGKSWGQGGFGKLVRNKNNQCGLASRAIFPVMHKDEYGRPILNGPRAQ
ncbi:cathepsin K-like [Parasteatoda tepidariorum]|uniref:cathepsin K-like n=1 Tax=Parasteatoda tepidariorum TaxID=114398 RepID=UPI001C718206|nr:procathepsin L-like [Parasteatoda tepidariorum]XP_042896944.1 procathepsin L-like [Parasteatoda tepidariorum]XP_042896945.1 procathepsin L-like [Parasteatoda tepidariorum]